MEIIIFKYLHYKIYLLEGKDYIAMRLLSAENVLTIFSL
nr:MAG TPA: hypothetical protein [Caudoviricetes sp.]